MNSQSDSLPSKPIDWNRTIEKEAQKSLGVKLLKDLAAMSRAMEGEAGLLNHSQAALVLDVSVVRIGELVRLAKLHRFDFLGRTYVSVREIMARREKAIQEGHPRRSGLKRAATAAKLLSKYDAAQAAAEIVTLGTNKKAKKTENLKKNQPNRK